MKERGFRLLIANIVIACVLLGTAGVAAYAVNANADGGTLETVAVYGGNTDGDAVSLMVNVYEGTEYALAIAKEITSRGFSTTFFVGGKWAERNASALIELYAAGIEIGNHGYLHRDHAKLSYAGNRDEIVMCERLVDKTLSSLPDYANCKLFAPPSGSLGENMFRAAADNGYTVVMWTRDTIDWRDHDADVIYARAVKNISAGDLILMHPTASTLAALPRILDTIESKGLKVNKVSEVICKEK